MAASAVFSRHFLLPRSVLAEPLSLCALYLVPMDDGSEASR